LPDDLIRVRERGVIIILLSLDREKMTLRNKYGQENEEYEDHTNIRKIFSFGAGDANY
jgi:hypothetical protein